MVQSQLQQVVPPYGGRCCLVVSRMVYFLMMRFFQSFRECIRDDGTPEPVGTDPERSGTGSGSVLGSREPDLKSQPSGFKLGSLSKCAASDSATLQFRASDAGRARSSCNGASR